MMMDTEQHIYSVTELNQATRNMLEESYGYILIEGEISSFVCPNSGHWYFTLKDAKSQIRCAMFRMSNSKVNFFPENGMQVVLQTKVSLYPDRGDYQLIVQKMNEIGAGALQRKFEELKAKLDKEGLFDEAHKQELPELPQTIGVITSATGAAIHDILTVLRRRYPVANVVVYPSVVQGEQAASSLINMLKIANKRKECDLLLISRGGGSMEDMWCFNDELLAREIFASKLPVVSAVGHEVDFTICDFVADVRAATPSAAAELITPDKQELLGNVEYFAEQCIQLFNLKFKELKQELKWMAKQLMQLHPQQQLIQHQQRLDLLAQSLHHKMQSKQNFYQQRFAILSEKLNTLSPLHILNRGYAFMTKDKEVIRSTKQLASGDKLTATLSDGKVECTITKM